MNRRAIAAIACTLAVLGGACSKGGGDDTVTVEASANFLAMSATRTLDARTGSFEMSMSLVGVPGAPAGLSFGGTGVYDADAGRMMMELDLSPLLDAGAGTGEDVPDELRAMFAEPIREIVDGTVVYMRFPFMARVLGEPGKEWISMDAAGLPGGSDLLGAGTGGLTSDPSAMLEFLRGAADDITEQGSEEVRGVSTTHLAGTFTLDRSLERVAPDMRKKLEASIETLGAGDFLTNPIPVDVFVDGEGRVRRMQMTMDVPGAGGQMTFSIDYFGFGDEVAIEVPDASDVQDLGGRLPFGG